MKISQKKFFGAEMAWNGLESIVWGWWGIYTSARRKAVTGRISGSGTGLVGGAESSVKKSGAKPFDNFLTQSHAKERNEKNQKRKKESKY